MMHRIYPTRFGQMHLRSQEGKGANPGAAFRAACGYAIEKKLKSLKAPLTVFAPHDDIIEQTLRAAPLLKAGCTYVDLPEMGQDPFHAAVDRMVTLVNRHLPP
jgi:hypothetical protein